MTNKYNNWERLEQVIAYTKLSAHGFAMSIGLTRSENIYHIKRGNFGISEDFAERIVQHYPEINPTWLLSGVGNMLRETESTATIVPFYEGDIEQILKSYGNMPPSGTHQLPYQCDCDIVLRTSSKAMVQPGTAATDLFLKHYAVKDIVQGNEYILRMDNTVLWRKVRSVKDSPDLWRLVAFDRVAYPDTFINKSDIRDAWRVIARLAILVR